MNKLLIAAAGLLGFYLFVDNSKKSTTISDKSDANIVPESVKPTEVIDNVEKVVET